MAKYRTGSKRRMIEDLIARGLNARQIFNELMPLVQNQIHPMIFAANENGRRVPKPISAQIIELRNEINRVQKIVAGDTDGTLGDSDAIPDSIPAEPIPTDEIPSDSDDAGTDEIPADPDDSDDAPRASGKQKFRNEMERFRSEIRRIRKWCQDRAESGALIDSISMRPAQAAARLIPLGVPADALLAACCMHWDDDAKRMAGIPAFDFVSFSRSVMRERGIEIGKYHELFGYALILAEARQPVMLIGPAGSGKSHIAKQLAEFLALPYGETPMTPGATRGDLLGRYTANPERPFVASEFNSLYGGGGVFNFEEIDASDPSMLIVLNNALAQETLYNSASGESVDKHADFIAVATANTFGTGANREYSARERLDAATIDRWRMGRIYIPIDENVEDSILDSAGI
jgi:AAA domain (dynein-related subfamily)